MTQENEIPYYELPDACLDRPSLATWLTEEGVEEDEACRPCVLPLVGKWYSEELRENGLGQEAEALDEFMERDDVDPLKLAEKLDSIKEMVDPNMVNRLKELDCEVQTNADNLTEVQDG